MELGCLSTCSIQIKYIKTRSILNWFTESLVIKPVPSWVLTKHITLIHLNFLLSGGVVYRNIQITLISVWVFTTSLGLNDSVEENGTTSKTKSSVFFAGIVNAGFFVTKNIAIDLRYEIGNGINYVSYKTADNFKTVASGHSSIQASIIVEF